MRGVTSKPASSSSSVARNPAAERLPNEAFGLIATTRWLSMSAIKAYNRPVGKPRGSAPKLTAKRFPLRLFGCAPSCASAKAVVSARRRWPRVATSVVHQADSPCFTRTSPSLDCPTGSGTGRSVGSGATHSGRRPASLSRNSGEPASLPLQALIR